MNKNTSTSTDQAVREDIREMLANWNRIHDAALQTSGDAEIAYQMTKEAFEASLGSESPSTKPQQHMKGTDR
jgi:hypothetical protein